MEPPHGKRFTLLQQNAERLFLSLAADGAVPEVFQAMDPEKTHQTRLEKIHGEGARTTAGKSDELEENGNKKSSEFGRCLLELTIRPCADKIVHLSTVTKKLPPNLLIRDVKVFVCGLFKNLCHPAEIELAVVNIDDPIGQVINDDYRELGFFAIGSGAELRVMDVAEESELD